MKIKEYDHPIDTLTFGDLKSSDVFRVGPHGDGTLLMRTDGGDADTVRLFDGYASYDTDEDMPVTLVRGTFVEDAPELNTRPAPIGSVHASSGCRCSPLYTNSVCKCSVKS